MKYFDAWFGAHQKIDRVARKHLDIVLPGSHFPAARRISKFEGIDGPDGIKRKTPAQDEPWHFYDPTNPNDTKILHIIEGHFTELVSALKANNTARSSFEAAWLAHALVDGLTPAHQYPYEEELIKLRGGAGIETRTSPKDKILIPGETLPHMVHNNWKMWGDKGLLATHLAFEWGVAVMAIPLTFKQSRPTPEQLQAIETLGVVKMFQKIAADIAALNIYETFYKTAWTPALGKTVRKQMMPKIISMVTLAWYLAAKQSMAEK